MRRASITLRHVVSTLAAMLGLVSLSARGQTYSNTAAISVPSSTTDGRAGLYPSQIVVSSAPTSIGNVSVTLSGFSHTFVSDIRALLVSPAGHKIMLMSNTNGGGDAANDNLTFIADGTAVLPYSAFDVDVVSGEYACSSYFTPFTLPTPAPIGPYTASLVPVLGSNANGTWRLFVSDFIPSVDNGAFSGGWSITFNQVPTPRPAPTAFSYQGRLLADGTPVSGPANVRFTLLNNPIALASVSQVGDVVTQSFPNIESGLISTSLDFGTAVDTNQSLWLNIEVERPPGSGFVPLTPRQLITPSPQARIAQVAATVPWTGLTGQAAVSTGGIGAGWQMLLNNSANTSFRGGLRLADNGFVEITNTAQLSNPNFARLSSNGTWSAVSDARLKTDVTSADGQLAAAMKLRPVNFRWKFDGREDMGLIAQDVREVLPALVSGDEQNGILSVNYSQLSVVAIGAIQELKAENDRKQQEIDELKARLDRLERAVERTHAGGSR